MSQFTDLLQAQASKTFLTHPLFAAEPGSVVYVPPTGSPVTLDLVSLLTDEDLPEIIAVAIPEYGRDGQSVRHFAAIEVPADMTVDLERGAFRINGDRYEIRKRVGQDVALQTLLLERTARTDVTPHGFKK